MADIAPTVTASTPEEYTQAVQNIEGFASRIHIDLADGQFAPTTLINPPQVWWPDGVTADIHVMYERPEEILNTLISLNPSLIVLHAEAEGDLDGMIEMIGDMEIKTGLALLKETSVESANGLIEMVDHVLVFSGDLGYHGGEVEFSLLEKVAKVKELNPRAEIGWDGGIKDVNARQLVEGGVDVLNTGGFIQHADNPSAAYQKIVDVLK